MNPKDRSWQAGGCCGAPLAGSDLQRLLRPTPGQLQQAPAGRKPSSHGCISEDDNMLVTLLAAKHPDLFVAWSSILRHLPPWEPVRGQADVRITAVPPQAPPGQAPRTLVPATLPLWPPKPPPLNPALSASPASPHACSVPASAVGGTAAGSDHPAVSQLVPHDYSQDHTPMTKTSTSHTPNEESQTASALALGVRGHCAIPGSGQYRPQQQEQQRQQQEEEQQLLQVHTLLHRMPCSAASSRGSHSKQHPAAAEARRSYRPGPDTCPEPGLEAAPEDSGPDVAMVVQPWRLQTAPYEAPRSPAVSTAGADDAPGGCDISSSTPRESDAAGAVVVTGAARLCGPGSTAGSVDDNVQAADEEHRDQAQPQHQHHLELCQLPQPYPDRSSSLRLHIEGRLSITSLVQPGAQADQHLLNHSTAQPPGVPSPCLVHEETSQQPSVFARDGDDVSDSLLTGVQGCSAATWARHQHSYTARAAQLAPASARLPNFTFVSQASQAQAPTAPEPSICSSLLHAATAPAAVDQVDQLHGFKLPALPLSPKVPTSSPSHITPRSTPGTYGVEPGSPSPSAHGSEPDADKYGRPGGPWGPRRSGACRQLVLFDASHHRATFLECCLSTRNVGGLTAGGAAETLPGPKPMDQDPASPQLPASYSPKRLQCTLGLEPHSGITGIPAGQVRNGIGISLAPTLPSLTSPCGSPLAPAGARASMEAQVNALTGAGPGGVHIWHGARSCPSAPLHRRRPLQPLSPANRSLDLAARATMVIDSRAAAPEAGDSPVANPRRISNLYRSPLLHQSSRRAEPAALPIPSLALSFMSATSTLGARGRVTLEAGRVSLTCDAGADSQATSSTASRAGWSSNLHLHPGKMMQAATCSLSSLAKIKS